MDGNGRRREQSRGERLAAGILTAAVVLALSWLLALGVVAATRAVF